MKELDVLLERFVAGEYDNLDEAGRADFLTLLECEDPVLWGWLLGQEEPNDPGLRGLVRRLREYRSLNRTPTPFDPPLDLTVRPSVGLLAWRRRCTPRAVLRVVWEGGDEWRWYRADGSIGRGRVAGSSLRLPWLVILHLRPENRRRIESLLLTAGSVGETDFRRLRARLRLLPY